MDSNATTTPATATPKEAEYGSEAYWMQHKWGLALSTVLAVGAVVYAAQTGRKGKFWWFLGGSMVGGAVGRLLDSAAKKS